jgi:hypothetical protein
MPAGDYVVMKPVDPSKGSKGSWSLIGRNGQEIGYVPSDALLKLKGN